MNGRERYLATVRHEAPDRLPMDSLGIECLPALAAHLGVAENQVRAHLGLDGVEVEAEYVGPARAAADGTPLSFWGTLRNRYGARREYPLREDVTPAEIERFPWPRTEDFNYQAPAQRARELDDQFAVRTPMWHPLFCQVCDLMGMEEALTTLALRPAVFEAIVERVFHFAHDHYEKMLNACGDHVSIHGIGDDFATQRGLMISPADWRRFLKPWYAKLIELGKRRGLFVMIHSCGDITEVLPDLLDIGVDIWQTVQLHTLPMTPEDLKRRFGRDLTFYGGINTQRLPFQSPAEVRAEVERCAVALGRGGGYVVSPDHAIKADVPFENVLALYESARTFRADGYTRAGLCRA